jgi:transcriptional regulator with XRE-family HTH domain
MSALSRTLAKCRAVRLLLCHDAVMTDQPTPRPEGILIKNARERGRLSTREAARRAQVSETRWRQIEKGYSIPAKGEYNSACGSARTLARMAQVVDVTPDDLEKAGRADAAERLRNLGDLRATTGRPDDFHSRIDHLMGQPKARRMLERMVTMLEEDL